MEKVSEKYSGFEVINYDSIIKKLSYEYKKTNILSWLNLFDFSSGCIWNLNDLKSVKYYYKYNTDTKSNKSNKSKKVSKSIRTKKKKTNNNC